METLVWIIHILAALGVIGMVLLQHGKGADMGAAFGSGSSGSLFGASGSANFLSRATGVLAAIFFVTSLSLTYFSSHRESKPLSVLDAAKSAPKLELPAGKPAAPVGQPGGNVPSKSGDIPN